MKYFIVIILLIFPLTNFGQSVNTCEVIYEKPDIKANYGSKESELYDFVIDDLVELIVKTDSIYPNEIFINFEIDAEGNVFNVDFMKITLSEQCKLELIKKCLAMKNWIPAKNNSIKVCSKYFLKVACINWE